MTEEMGFKRFLQKTDIDDAGSVPQSGSSDRKNLIADVVGVYVRNSLISNPHFLFLVFSFLFSVMILSYTLILPLSQLQTHPVMTS